EARAAARRHKNPLRIHRAGLDSVARYEEIVLVTPSGPGAPVQRMQLAHGSRQLVIVGASPSELSRSAADRMRIATLGLEPVESAPLRLTASIVLAEIARQVGGDIPELAWRHEGQGTRRRSRLSPRVMPSLSSYLTCLSSSY